MKDKNSDNIESSLKIFLDNNLSVHTSLDATGESGKTKRYLQHMMSIKHSDSRVQSLYESVLSYAITAEKKCPTSGEIFLTMLLGGNENQAVKVEKVRTRSQVLNVLKSRNYSKKSLSILEETLLQSTSNSKISIKKSSSEKFHIERVEGYSFNVIPLIKTQSLFLENPRIACIDGYVESVSEIHHILTDLSEKKSTCILLVRGMSDDVLHTLKVNNDRKTVLVFPFSIAYDIENVNTIVDIAVVSGTDVLSSTKGDLISSLRYENLGSVENCTISGGEIRMKNSATKNRVAEHLNHLRNSIEQREEISDLLSKRLRSLTANCIDICIPDDLNYYSTSQQLDEGVRIISSLINNTYDPIQVATGFLASYRKVLQNSAVFTFS